MLASTRNSFLLLIKCNINFKKLIYDFTNRSPYLVSFYKRILIFIFFTIVKLLAICINIFVFTCKLLNSLAYTSWNLKDSVRSRHSIECDIYFELGISFIDIPWRSRKLLDNKLSLWFSCLRNTNKCKKLIRHSFSAHSIIEFDLILIWAC